MSEQAPTRRFMPMPVETSVKSNRKFAVEPVETSTRSSNAKKQQESSSATPQLPKKPRFAPQPIETSARSNRANADTSEPSSSSNPPSHSSSASSAPADVPSKPTRRFAPQLIETVKRIKRAGDIAPATLPTDKTDITPGTKHIYLPKRKPKERPLIYPAPPTNSPNASASLVPRITPRREQSMKPHLNTRRSTRQDSFHSELEPIVSDGDGEEAEDEEAEQTPSLSGSFGDSSEDSMRRLRLARTRESCDDRFSGYLLALAAKAAEKQLREQALAAFPNESVHEVVEHFYDREIEGGSEDDEIITAVGLLPLDDEDDISVMHIERRPTEIGWALKEMQEHQENLQKMRDEEEEKKLAEETRQPEFKDPFWTNGMTNKLAAVAAAGVGAQDQQKKFELERMQKAASPPMLGGDLKFRMCPSPKSTKLETDQIHEVIPNRSDSGGGLWGGYCVANETQQYLSLVPRGPLMIHTPAVERDDPFASALGTEAPPSEKTSPTTPTFLTPKPSAPPSPTTQKKQPDKGIHLVAGINDRLKAQAKKSKLEEEIEREFDDEFVTQVYNYLSLGYPALAWAFDLELSKISQVPIEELRKNDRSKDIKGHMGTPESSGAKEGHCARWMALKLYVREWARQHPSMAEGGGGDMWGVRARRGSWAI